MMMKKTGLKNLPPRNIYNESCKEFKMSTHTFFEFNSVFVHDPLRFFLSGGGSTTGPSLPSSPHFWIIIIIIIMSAALHWSKTSSKCQSGPVVGRYLFLSSPPPFFFWLNSGLRVLWSIQRPKDSHQLKL